MQALSVGQAQSKLVVMSDSVVGFWINYGDLNYYVNSYNSLPFKGLRHYKYLTWLNSFVLGNDFYQLFPLS